MLELRPARQGPRGEQVRDVLCHLVERQLHARVLGDGGQRDARVALRQRDDVEARDAVDEGQHEAQVAVLPSISNPCGRSEARTSTHISMPALISCLQRGDVGFHVGLLESLVRLGRRLEGADGHRVGMSRMGVRL